MANEAQCPFSSAAPQRHHMAGGGQGNRDWWPDQLNLAILHQHSSLSNPMGEDFDYAEEFKTARPRRGGQGPARADDRLAGLVAGRLRPLRPVLHPHGLARRGHLPHRRRPRRRAAAVQQRFAPLNSWPDNGNLDKARRLLWPIKQKYGRKLSWADLMILAGNVALESMGFKTFGFGGGRADVWEPSRRSTGAPESNVARRRALQRRARARQPARRRADGPDLRQPAKARTAIPTRSPSARDIRETFARMAMNDEETVALVAGGHTFGKATAPATATHVGAEPEGANIEEQGLGWKNSFGSGMGAHTITSGLEGAWTADADEVGQQLLRDAVRLRMGADEEPGRRASVEAEGRRGAGTVPDAHDPGQAQRADDDRPPTWRCASIPAYEKISRRFMANPEEFADAFARAWFKLTHRDMGPRARYLGPLVPKEELIWQDPVPAVDHPLVDEQDIAALKAKMLASGLSIAQLVTTAWASASTFRGSDKRGGANGARIRLAPQKDWEVNEPAELAQGAGQARRRSRRSSTPRSPAARRSRWPT